MGDGAGLAFNCWLPGKSLREIAHRSARRVTLQRKRSASAADHASVLNLQLPSNRCYGMMTAEPVTEVAPECLLRMGESRVARLACVTDDADAK